VIESSGLAFELDGLDQLQLGGGGGRPQDERCGDGDEKPHAILQM
jgi:hypothetical protein